MTRNPGGSRRIAAWQEIGRRHPGAISLAGRWANRDARDVVRERAGRRHPYLSLMRLDWIADVLIGVSILWWVSDRLGLPVADGSGRAILILLVTRIVIRAEGLG